MTSPVQKIEFAANHAAPIFWGCAAACMVGITLLSYTGYLFWSHFLD